MAGIRDFFGLLQTSILALCLFMGVRPTALGMTRAVMLRLAIPLAVIYYFIAR